jgi:hypothetical protein
MTEGWSRGVCCSGGCPAWLLYDSVTSRGSLPGRKWKIPGGNNFAQKIRWLRMPLVGLSKATRKSPNVDKCEPRIRCPSGRLVAWDERVWPNLVRSLVFKCSIEGPPVSHSDNYGRLLVRFSSALASTRFLATSERERQVYLKP